MQSRTLLQRKRSNSTIAAGKDEDKERNEITATGKVKSAWTHFSNSLTDSWIPEVASLATSIALLIGLAILFFVYNSKFTSTWKARLSFPTVVAIVAKASQAALAVPVASCLSQMGWMHFHKQNAALDFQRFDVAARSPLGTFRLLFTVPSGMAFLSFLIVIPGLGFKAAAQQCLEVKGPTMIPVLAQLNRLSNSTGNNAIVSDGLKDAAARALATRNQQYSRNGPLIEMVPNGNARTQVALPRSLDYSCATTDCVPPPYATLSMCSTCDDISHELVLESSDVAALPSGGSVDIYGNVLSITPHHIDYDYSDSWKGTLTLANFSLIESIFLLPGGTGLESELVQTFAAQRCVINLCTNIYQLDISAGSTGMSGANETRLASVTQSLRGRDGQSTAYWSLPVPDGTVLRYPDQSTTNWRSGPLDHFDTNSPGFGTFTADYGLDNSSLTFLSDYFASLFNGSDSQRWSDGTPLPEDTSTYAQQAAGTGFWNSLSYILTTYNYNDLDDATIQINGAISNIVTSMGNWARDYAFTLTPSSGGNPYYAGVRENTYHIRWAWFALPVAVELLAVILLLLTIQQTRQTKLPVWKTSAIAVMFQGIAQPEGSLVSNVEKVSDMEHLAAGKRVKLAITLSGYRLVDMEQGLVEDPSSAKDIIDHSFAGDIGEHSSATNI